MFIFSVDPDDPSVCGKLVEVTAYIRQTGETREAVSQCIRDAGHEGECWVVKPEE